MNILQNVKFCPPVTFDGLAGTLTTSRKGSLGGIFYACSIPYLLTKVKPLNHTITTQLPERSADALGNAFQKHCGFYGQRGIRIATLLSRKE